jgi:hypothetical protein
MTNIGNIATKVNLDQVVNPVQKALLALVDQLPFQQRKKAIVSTTNVVQSLVQHLIKFVAVCLEDFFDKCNF